MADRLAENVARVRETVARAATASGRVAEAVTLVAVTKTVDAQTVRRLYGLGVRDFGENRIHAAEPKIAELALPDARWHFIGHLQRNKARAVAGCCAAVHSLDSVRLAEELARHVRPGGRLDVFLEIKTSTEASKLGLDPAEAEAVLAKAFALPSLTVRGLMTMAPFADDPEAARPYFAALRDLRDRLEARCGVKLPDLSMGMSNDYPVAIGEGATLVRVGSALFEGVM